MALLHPDKRTQKTQRLHYSVQAQQNSSYREGQSTLYKARKKGVKSYPAVHSETLVFYSINGGAEEGKEQREGEGSFSIYYYLGC